MTPAMLARVMEATWPPARCHRLGPWLLREGRGGGKRVSAATAEGDWTAADLAVAETAMRDLGQPSLFMIRPGDERLDAALAQRGYRRLDPVVGYAAPIADLAMPVPPMSTFPHWPPLEIAVSIWAAAGIGPARLAVMHRVKGARTVILARSHDRAVGAAFVAVSEGVAMLHALEISPVHRRQGSAQNILRAAAIWAQDQGADSLSLMVTEANAAARALYEAIGMRPVGGYHYRQA